MAGAASQAGDADSSRAPGLTFSLQGSVNVHRGALWLVPHWLCITSFVFYIEQMIKIMEKNARLIVICLLVQVEHYFESLLIYSLIINAFPGFGIL